MRGFTLIEAVIYIALLGLIMTGALTIAYQLISSSTSLDTRNISVGEGNFVLRKIDWALSGMQSISAPGAWGSTLSLTRDDGTTVDMRLNAGKVEMRENGGSYAPLTTSNVAVTSLSFHYIAAAGNVPAGLEASTTINGLVFYTDRYIRK